MDVLPSCYFRFHLIPEDSLEFLGIILFRDLGDSFGIYQDSSGVIWGGGSFGHLRERGIVNGTLRARNVRTLLHNRSSKKCGALISRETLSG